MNTKHSLRKFAFPLLLALLLCLPLAHAAAAAYPESDHPYAANSDVTWSYTHDTAADYLAITFSADSTLENGWDYLYLTDESGLEQTFTGSLADKTVRIAGDSFTLRLTSDGSVQYYGFAISSIKALSEEEFATPVFTVSNGTLTSVEGGAPGATLTIPKTVDGQTITAIGSYALQGCTFGKIILPDTVTSISNYAFFNSTSLTSVTLPSGLTSIGRSAFENCSNLTIPSIPASVTTIGNYAFYGCKCEGDVILPDNISSLGYTVLPTGVYPIVTTGSVTESTMMSGGRTFRRSTQPDYALYYDAFDEKLCLRKYLGSAAAVSLPSDVQELYSSAFEDNTTITTVTLPQGLTSIPDDTFQGCTSLTSITLPSSLTSIGYNAFRNCSSLPVPAIPAGVTEIDSYAFYGCVVGPDVTLPDNITSVGSSILPYGMYPIVTTGSTTENTFLDKGQPFRRSTQPDYALYYDTSAKKLYLYAYVGSSTAVSLPSDVQELYSSAFAGNTTITTVTLPKSLTSIPDYAFQGCTSLTNITLPSSLTSIGYSAFEDCSSLTVPAIPDSVTEIGSYAFYGCKSEGDVTLPDNITSIGYGILPNGMYPIVTTGSTTESTYLDKGSYFRRSTHPDFVIYYSSYAEALYLSDYVGDDAVVTVPEGIQKLGSSVFSESESITSLILPDSLIELNEYALYDCPNLSSVTLPNSITTLPDSFLVDPDLIITIHQDSPLLPLLIEHGHPYKIIETGEVFNVVDDTATTASQKVDAIVAAVIRPEMTDYQKALALHNWLMNNCYYDETYSHYSGEYMLLHGTGVCQSYAEAYRMLLNKVGIPNCLEHGSNHVWNMIQLDGDWYHVDVTWDDPIGGGTGNERWDFFCLSNYALQGVDNHECYNKPHIGTAYKYNYAYRNGQLDERLDEVESLIVSNLQAGLLEFSFTPESFEYDYPYGIPNRTAVLVIQDTTYYVNGTRTNLDISYDDATMTFTVKAEMSTPDFTLPAALKTVGAEAFAGSGVSVVWVPDGVTSIGAKAFADCPNLYQIRIPASVTSISDTAFENVDGLCIFAPSGSAAEAFASAHGFSFSAED